MDRHVSSDPERIKEAYDAVRKLGLSLGALLEGCLSSRDERIRQASSNWARYTPERSFGPLRLPLIDVELERARSISTFLAAYILQELCQRRHDEIKLLQDNYARHLPLTSALVDMLVPVSRDDTEATSDDGNSESCSDQDINDGQKDEASPSRTTGEGSSRSGKRQRAQIVIISVALAQRSRRMNALQTMPGTMLVFHYAPRSTQTLLNRLSLSTSRSQSHRHLAQIAENAKSDAKALMQDSKRVKVLLFDNIDLYLRVGERITASNRLVNLTSRTMLRLPAAFDAANVSADKLKPLRGARRLSIEHVVGEPAFLERAITVQVAKELLEVLKEWVKRTSAAASSTIDVHQPAQPLHPAHLAPPSQTAHPALPVPTAHPSHFPQPAQPTNPADSVQPLQPAQPAQPTHAAEPTQSPQPDQSARPAHPAQPAQPGQPSPPAHPAEPLDPEGAVHAVQPVQPAQPQQERHDRRSQSPGKRAHTDLRPAQAFRLMQRLVSNLTQAHAIDELDPSRWEAVPLPLLEENEGSILEDAKMTRI
ncbi:hypothetical protein V8E36_000551 [Tilletia maclaganii]